MKSFSVLFLAPFLIFPLTSLADYDGSSFNDVLNVIDDRGFNPQSEIEKQEFSIYQNHSLPQYPMNMKSIFFNGSTALERDAKRTVNERFDYYDRLPKKLHPNGVCVSGQWQIDRETAYSGFFAKGSNGLFIGRISVAMEDTTSDDPRGFGFAGKVFPTINPNEVVTTGNFFTVDELMGTDIPRMLDASTTNEPELGFRFNLITLGMKLASALSKADKNPMFRPLTQVASLKIKLGEAVKQPKWIRLTASSTTVKNNEKDFRNEILHAMEENKEIKYSIEVSDLTKDRKTSKGWNKVGEIKLNHAVVSYGCDRRLHFAHPKLK